MSVGLLILGLVLFIQLVVVHEFGHFIVARRNGVDVEEFGLGFPPRAKVLVKKKGTLYTLNWLPLGGFVRLKGEHDADKGLHSYGAAKLKTKVKILLAGVGMNLLAAFVLLTFLALVGMPQLITPDAPPPVNQKQFTVASDTKIIKDEVFVSDVEDNSPASKAGLKLNDQMLSVAPTADPSNKQIVTNQAKLSALTKEFAGQKVVITFKRGSNVLTAVATLRARHVVEGYDAKHDCKNTGDCIGYLGVAPTDYTLQRSTWSAPIVAGGLIGQFTVLTFKGLGIAVHGLGSLIAAVATGNHAAREAAQSQASGQVAGPIGIFFILKAGGTLGYQFMLTLIAIISLTLALINVLPIPALDGGKLFLTLVFHALRKKLTVRIENWAYGLGFALLMLLIILISNVDVQRLIHHIY